MIQGYNDEALSAKLDRSEEESLQGNLDSQVREEVQVRTFMGTSPSPYIHMTILGMSQE